MENYKMKITKSQLKQIIKEELERVLNENSGVVIPQGATVRNSGDPIGISWEIGSGSVRDGEYDEIPAYELSPELLQQIGDREDLTFKHYGKEMSGGDFIMILLNGWREAAEWQRSKGVASSLPDWVETQEDFEAELDPETGFMRTAHDDPEGFMR